MKLKTILMNLINIFLEVNDNNDGGFDYFSLPRILAYITLALALIFLLIILLRYLIKKKKSKINNDENKDKPN